jgi:Predicted pyridoxal phosphate-dependent enzyme apparently involved in regulation of cell wall biogenesis
VKKFKYKLLSNAFNKKDIDIGTKIIRSKQLTISFITRKFEKYFAKKIGAKYAIMTNSGSSANLMALSALTNPLSKKIFKPGSEIIIPAVCWSTSLWPILQNNLKPVFVDVELDSFNIDLDKLKKKINKKTKAIVLVHVLGLSTNRKN